MNIRIEVPRNHHERIGIGIEQSFREQPRLKRLSGALHAGEEEALGPATHRAP